MRAAIFSSSGPLRGRLWITAALALSPVALLLGGCMAAAPQAAADAAGPLDASRQLVVVTAADWNSTTGTLQRYERGSAMEQWQAVGQSFPIVLGASGLAWGRGVHGEAPSAEHRKREGDGRSPAGVFTLSAVFGYASVPPAGSAPGALPYVQATTTTECVDDPGSVHYNSLLDRAATKVDWNSAEHMRRDDELYRVGIFVDHNTGPAQPGAGSCIFIHIWEGPASTTVGCTAGDAARIAELAAWLERGRNPRLVQLPRTEYLAHAQAWRLPTPLTATGG